jgi:FlaA1/EpsC-like NDP-sugar epimerase
MTIFSSVKRLITISYDLLIIPIAWFGAYCLRFNFETIPPTILHHALNIFPIIVILQAVCYWRFGLHRGMWRFASIPDLLRIFQATLVGSGLIALGLLFFTNIQLMPRSVVPIYALLLIILLGSSRLLVRWCKDYGRFFNQGKRVLIIGAGQAGEGLVRDLLRYVDKLYYPIAFVDDASTKQGKEIHGIRVVGKCKNIPEIVKKWPIELIIIALPSATSARMREIIAYCSQTKIPVRTLPSLKDIANGLINVNSLREVSLEDLLGREPVSLEWDKINKKIQNKVLLVTGGGGSIGSELCRQIAKLGPKKLIVVEHSEYNLYALEQEFKQRFPHLSLRLHLGSVTDETAINQLMQRYVPDLVFHAAAYKHVPMLETQIRTAVLNNVLGTKIVAEAAVAAGVKEFVLISTDKAVNPTNIMGTTKRIAEIFCQNFNDQVKTNFTTVRFGNVLGSAGSVVPLFKQQLANGGPLTVTHPEITRYFMTIPEAAQLILQASVLGKGGEIFVLDMGEPIKIRYLAEQMIRLSGRSLDEISIIYSGLRPGEKLHEELFHEQEALVNTRHSKILRARHREIEWSELKQYFIDIQIACEHFDYAKLREIALILVPEYHDEKENLTENSPLHLKLIKAGN